MIKTAARLWFHISAHPLATAIIVAFLVLELTVQIRISNLQAQLDYDHATAQCGALQALGNLQGYSQTCTSVLSQHRP